MAEFALPLPFQIDHIAAEQHGGETSAAVEDGPPLLRRKNRQSGRYSRHRDLQFLLFSRRPIFYIEAALQGDRSHRWAWFWRP
jgi:hypothetical protein